MLYMAVTGIPPYDGRYEFDPERDFTTREWGWIKTLAGYLPLTISDGFEGADPELFAALAVICLHRAGKVDTRQIKDVYDRILDAPFGTTLRLEDDQQTEVDGDAVDLQRQTQRERATSGDGSPTSRRRWCCPEASGTPASASSVWPSVTSGT